MISALIYEEVPSPLPEQEKAFLKELDRRIWRESRDRFNNIHRFPQGKPTSGELVVILAAIQKHVLPCILRSGPYGDLSFSIYDHSSLPQIPPEYVAMLHQDHFGLAKGFDKWDSVFDELSKITHNERNKQVLAFYGFSPPGPRDDYRY